MRVKHKSHQKPQQQTVSPTLVAAVRPQDELSDWETDLLEALANGELNREEVLVLGTAMEPSEQGARSVAGPSDKATAGTIGALKERGITDDRIVEVLTDERVQSAIAEAEHKKAETDQKYQTADQREATRHGKNRGDGGEVSSDALFEVLDTIGAGVENLAGMGDWQLMAAMVGLDLASGGIVKTVLKQLGLIDKLAKGAGVDLEKLTGQLADKILAYSKGTDLAGLKKMDPAKLARARLAANALVSSMLLGTKKAAKRIKTMSATAKKAPGKLDSQKAKISQSKFSKSSHPNSKTRKLSGDDKGSETFSSLDRFRLPDERIGLTSGGASAGFEGINMALFDRPESFWEGFGRLTSAGLIGAGAGKAGFKIADRISGSGILPTVGRIGTNTFVGAGAGAASGTANIAIQEGRLPTFDEVTRSAMIGGLLGAAGAGIGETAARRNPVNRRLSQDEIDKRMVDQGMSPPAVGDPSNPPSFLRSVLPKYESPVISPEDLKWIRRWDTIGDVGAVVIPNSGPIVEHAAPNDARLQGSAQNQHARRRQARHGYRRA